MKKLILLSLSMFTLIANSNAQIVGKEIKSESMKKEMEVQEKTPPVLDEEYAQIRKTLMTPITEFDINRKLKKRLLKSEVFIMADLVSLSEKQLDDPKMFSKNDLSDLEELVAEKNLSFGMDVAKYNLDED